MNRSIREPREAFDEYQITRTKPWPNQVHAADTSLDFRDEHRVPPWPPMRSPARPPRPRPSQRARTRLAETLCRPPRALLAGERPSSRISPISATQPTPLHVASLETVSMAATTEALFALYASSTTTYWTDLWSFEDVLDAFRARERPSMTSSRVAPSARAVVALVVDVVAAAAAAAAFSALCRPGKGSEAQPNAHRSTA